MLEFLISPTSSQRKILERYFAELPSQASCLFLLKEFKLPLDLKIYHPELFKLNHFDLSEILMLVARKRSQDRATRLLILRLIEHLLASYLIYLDLSFFVDLVFWIPAKKISWRTWTYCIPHCSKILKIHLPSNLLLPFFWIEKWILGHHALQRLSQQLLNIEQLPSQKRLIEMGTEEEFLRILEAPSVNSLKNQPIETSFGKLLLVELSSY